MGGFFKDLSEGLGLSKADAQTVDPTYFSQLYDEALKNLRDVGGDTASVKNREMINSALAGQLGDLENNAAGRKANFLEDSSRAFGADVQSIARAKGGTGTLAQALRPTGAMYDAQGRANARGLNDLYSQATQDIGNLSNTQMGLQGMDQNRANGIANAYQTELASRRGQANSNADNTWNAGVQQQKALGGTLQAGAAGAAMAMGSDIRLKTEIEPTSEELLEFLDSMSAFKYKYKDEKFGKGEHYSVMAQDLEKTKVGRSMVIDTPEGKMVDYGRGFAVMLASQTSLNQRLKALEGAIHG